MPDPDTRAAAAAAAAAAPEGDEAAWVAELKAGLYPKLRESSLVVSLGGSEPDPKQMLEFGAALYFDKPLVIVVLPGHTIPRRVRRAADVVLDEFDPASRADQGRLQVAIETLMDEAHRERRGQPE